MKLYAPEYYKNFVCIADKCKHSCCIGWEIDIDEHTLNKYNSLSRPYKETILDSIEKKDVPHFKLAKHDRCPHLNTRGLCDIILNVGENYLCDICREHPRFYNYTTRGKEVGIGISCEEACRIVLTSDNYTNIIEIDSVNETPQEYEFDAVRKIENIYKMLSDRSVPYNERIERISRKYEIYLNVNSDAEWRNFLASLEYLDNSHKDIFANYSSSVVSTPDNSLYAERILAYFIYRHCSQADTYEVFRASLSFALFCEKLFLSILEANKLTNIDDIVNVARIISEEIEYSEDNSDNIKLEFYF